jgi:hypothetical protein
MTFRIVEESDRVSAVDEDDIEIVGAYRPDGHNYFLLYATQLTTRKAGVPIPHHAAFWDNGSGRARADARHWVEMIASLYTGDALKGDENVA